MAMVRFRFFRAFGTGRSAFAGMAGNSFRARPATGSEKSACKVLTAWRIVTSGIPSLRRRRLARSLHWVRTFATHGMQPAMTNGESGREPPRRRIEAAPSGPVNSASAPNGRGCQRTLPMAPATPRMTTTAAESVDWRRWFDLLSRRHGQWLCEFGLRLRRLDSTTGYPLVKTAILSG